MVPLILLLGKFNTGKSKFFNFINHSEENLSFNFKSLTLFNKDKFNIFYNINYLIIDSLGFNFFLNFKINLNIFILDSDLIFFFLDNLSGIFFEDKIVSIFLKKNKKYTFLIINKLDISKININIFVFFKLGFKRPYLISGVNNFNLIYLIKSLLSIFCFSKKCFHFFKKQKKIKITIISDFIFLKKFLKLFFLKNLIFLSKKNLDTFNFYFFFNKNLISFICFNLFLNKIIYIRKKYFINLFKSIIISDVIFFFIKPDTNFKNLFFINIILKNFKFLIFFINNSIFLNIFLKIYFKNFFKKKFNLYFFYIFFIYIFKEYNFFYILYYINKLFNFMYIKLDNDNLKKFIYNFNKFLFFFYKKVNIKVYHLHQSGKNPPSITIHGKNFFKLKSYTHLINIIKFNLFYFFKIKSMFLIINYV